MNRRTLFQGALAVLTLGVLPRKRGEDEDDLIRAGPWYRDVVYFEDERWTATEVCMSGDFEFIEFWEKTTPTIEP